MLQKDNKQGGGGKPSPQQLKPTTNKDAKNAAKDIRDTLKNLKKEEDEEVCSVCYERDCYCYPRIKRKKR